jgi:transcriptional regulator with XRE-family HTH domain
MAPVPNPADIGERARMIRKRRGLSLKAAAGLAGMAPSYLSMLENGQRRFDRRGLINDVANALGCSPIDLTGEPYGPSDHATAQALTNIPAIQLALYDVALDDVPDVPARPIDLLVQAVRDANAHRDQTDYARAGRDLGAILTELQVWAATGDGATRRAALEALVEVGIVGYELLKNLGHPELAMAAASRGHEAAVRLGDPGLLGFASWYNGLALMRLGAGRRANTVLAEAVTTLEPAADPSAERTVAAEVYGLLHMTTALQKARAGDAPSAEAHLAEADAIAARTGEKNSLRQHFGPTNVALWRLSIEVELQHGAGAYERAVAAGINTDVLGSKNRVGGFHFDLARALAQDGGARDWEAVQHLDRADRVAPHRIRLDPIARELLASLDYRARRATWEMGSLRNRFGLS